MVIIGALQMLDACKDTITNPSLIIEVLSSSTKDYAKSWCNWFDRRPAKQNPQLPKKLGTCLGGDRPSTKP
jgi:hypothetical protein